MKEFDLEELSAFNGQNGQPCYIAYKDRVIDVSESRLWRAGSHMKRHLAGRDLTLDIKAAPHGVEVLDKYPQVGILKSKPKEQTLPGALEVLMERFPFLRRHPHPMVVHFPMVFSISPAFFYLLYLITDVKSFEATALHCLGANILFIVPATATGFLTWWINYQAKPMKAVRIKIYASFILMTIVVISFLWRILFLENLVVSSMEGILYFLLLLSLIPIVSVIGWYGGSLTFPVEEK
ncbi:MAG: cytochrome b5 domain-containing protein [Pseudomonadota bacterium]|nr:cytochrome b5 domain-containing protein [Pseudomonadota bacterium]